tara:strand:+ start:4886 stop:5533 length:648 start_codon:yes stop_codon:yes gene_type:complete
MARWHAPNRCKKRLAKTIGIKNAALIQEKLTKHTLEVAGSIQKKGLAEIHLAISGLGTKACKRIKASLKISKVVPQGKGNLGIRMKKQVLRVQKKRIDFNRIQTRKTIIIGTDLPTLCENDLLKASLALENNEIVLGPSKDGGYWLIGFSSEFSRSLPAWPFCGIEWGSANVLQLTMDKAKEKNINFQLLREQNDLDKIEDLLPWIQKQKKQNLA